jgi:uncharacterized membrane protein YbaN (DUF454 family)
MRRFLLRGFFITIEVVGFFLPAFPTTFRARFLILSTYFVGHAMHLQQKYAALKRHYLAAPDGGGAAAAP